MFLSFKPEVNEKDLDNVKFGLFFLLQHAILFNKLHKYPGILVTSLMTDRNGIKSSSMTHADGRAVDISVRGWTADQIHYFVEKFNNSFGAIGAIGKDGVSRAALFHDIGYGAHIHLQVRPSANMLPFLFALN